MTKLIDGETGEVLADVTPERARELTDGIKSHLTDAWGLVIEAYQGRAWRALGHQSWDEYCEAEFGTGRLRLPREERFGTVKSLRDAGLSIRAIESVTGASRKTVIKDIKRAGGGDSTTPPAAPPSADTRPEPEAKPSSAPPAPVRGVDGKQYPASKPSAPKAYRPDLDYRVNASKAAVKARDLLRLDPDRIAEVIEPDDRETYSALADDLERFAESLRTALRKTSALRAVKGTA